MMKKHFKILIYTMTVMIVLITAITINNLKKNIDNKKDQIIFLKKNLNNKKEQLKNIHSKLLKKNINIENLVFEDDISFKSKSKKNLIVNENEFLFSEHYSKDIIFAKHPEASSSAYLEYYDKKIFLATATGQITYANISSLSKDVFKFQSIKSNIQQIIKYFEFYNSSAFGIKDILIHDNQIYVSYIKEHYKDCYSTSILVGSLNYNYIDFEEFYSPNSCIEKNNSFFNTSKHDKLVVHQSGGRMLIIENELIFSTGEYRYRILAQDKNSDFGKIISINLKDRNKKIVSMGHRNPQGLFYNSEINKLFSTEHGPSGGDEINIINFDEYKKNIIPNYGWPISSYGRHYFDGESDEDPRYELSPLKKSHSKYGFIEPLKYFVPSVGISQIIGVPNNFYKSNNKTFIVGTMGTAKKLKEGMISLFFFEYNDKKNKIEFSDLIPIKSRVRDLIYAEDQNIILMYLETNNSIGILKKNN